MGTNRTAPTVRFDPASEEFAWHAYEHYAELREQSPVHRLIQPDGTEVWLILRYEDARAALGDRRLSKDPRIAPSALEEAGLVRPGEVAETGSAGLGVRLPTPDLMFSDPPEHTRLRRLVSRAFTPRRVERLRPRIEALTDHLLDEMAVHDEVDLLGAFGYPLATIVICELLGVPSSDHDRIHHWVEAMLATNPDAHPDPSEETFAQYASELVRTIAPNVRHDVPEDEQPNLIHALLVAGENGDRLTQAETLDMLNLLLGAGTSDTPHLIGNGMLALLRHPDQRELLRQRPELLPNAIEELLRYDGPNERATFRFSLEPLTVGGITIPKHRMVGVVIASADRDPNQFESPDRLDITRPRPHHLGFGHGIHSCLGAPLGRLEAQIGFGRLLQRFPDMELACPTESLRFYAAGYLARGFLRVPVRLHGERPERTRLANARQPGEVE